jgi:hypothetical protein
VVWGGFVGATGFFVFQLLGTPTDSPTFRGLPLWFSVDFTIISAGVLAGALVGFLSELVHIWDEHSALAKRRQILFTQSNDLASQFSLSEDPGGLDTNEHIQKLAKPMD